MFKKSLLLFILVTLASCNASKPLIVTKKAVSQKPKTEVVQTAKKPKTPAKPSTQVKPKLASEVIESTSKTVVTTDLINGYIFHYKEIAMTNMRMYGIPASIILAQGILESGAGNGDLAVSANNHFGIKCYTDWTGESVRHDDDTIQECFRKYKNPEESFKDHANILSNRKRYASLFNLRNGDYKAWARGLRAAGYATDPKYPDKLISYIERFNLHQYDLQVSRDGDDSILKQLSSKIPLETKNTTNPKENLYEVQKSDTLYSISKKFNLSVEELQQKNSLINNSISIGQKLKVK